MSLIVRSQVFECWVLATKRYCLGLPFEVENCPLSLARPGCSLSFFLGFLSWLWNTEVRTDFECLSQTRQGMGDWSLLTSRKMDTYW